MRRKTLIMCYCWAIVTLVYYGISLNPSALAGDFYASFILSSLTEFVGVTFLIFTLNRLGRRPIQTAGFLLAGAALIAILLVPSAAPSWITLGLVMVAKVSIVSAFCTIYLYTSEIFPTVIRSIAIGLASTCARIGGIASPFASLFLDEEGNRLVLLGVFGTSSIIAALLSLLLPETVHRRLPETLADGEAFSTDLFPCSSWPSRESIDKKPSEQPLVPIFHPAAKEDL